MEKKTFRRKTGRPGKNKFVVPDEQTRPVESMRGVPPQNQPAVAIMASDEKRYHLSAVMNQYRKTILDVVPIRSNAELLQRGSEYFAFCSDRRLFPTIEGLAAFCGYSTRQLLRWEKKESVPFHDGDSSTAEIVERLKGFLEAIDAQFALDGTINPVTWIFRRKTVSGWVEAQRLELVSANDLENKPPLTPEEIARRLPNPDDYVIADDDYSSR